jgi:hypothetical protein
LEFPVRDLPATIWGDPAHFTLCDEFEPAERCRELVFWSVDWLSYVDCETCPSAAIDAGKYPIAGPLMNRSFADRMGTLKWCDASIFSFRNPEKDIVFTADVSDLPTGADISALLMPYTSETITPDAGAGLEARARFLGRYGADRNGDNHLDRGPLPASARLRAQLAARLNFYDPRVPAILR